ncbi:t-SNARE [Ascobolus immersus RN42]|uniref:t-SNARE n=1 Tax=Ascobolus immersus RN42 TaxID=1160509 RepID=A0A3N4ILP1_ASCIM|nr:t-SNARE [Ascobolus immersus RN42]
MSFAHLSNLEAQPIAGGQNYSDDPTFDNLIQTLSNKLFTINSNTSRLKQQLGLLGTNKDSEAVRGRVKTLLDQTRDAVKDVTEGMKKVKSWDDVTPAQKFQQDRLGRQYTSALTEFQAVQRLSLEKQRQYVSAARHAQANSLDAEELITDMASPSSSPPSVPLVAQQLALADQGEVDFQEQLIQEREAQIQDIESGMMEINEIFRDLSHIVTAQGEMLDTIESNVGVTRDHMQAADRELVSANNWQKGARRRAACLMLIVAIITGIVVLAVIS